MATATVTELPDAHVPEDQSSNTSDKMQTKLLNEKNIPNTTTAPVTEYLTHIPDEYVDSIIKALGGPPPLKHSLSQHIWPPSGLNEGLYKDVLRYRHFAQYKFYFASLLYNFCLVTQLILGAALTSLSASSASRNGTAITIIAAANTVNAGLVALLHNSGLPSRLRNDMVEYEKVQIWIEEIMRGGVALGVLVEGGAGDSTITVRDKVVGEASARFLRARMTVEKNRPNAYSATNATTPLPGVAPQPGTTV
ncbi:hypothetical protein GLAREA_07332 [Glarea lozoyensis ATCC 20868]|uniref:SMODS and SLOG-associating 2TM effector domain-containing protein n=1 Tax=Glarea lozoyensis (strain ATCC 20868 / MF5171) TaxID=1116229 RepID=S3D532_GLAL2|nr:uncharacterized protein GLAREA_07332 [Glarea lozoyensis ATCC 20868]EPE32199.1 hypothetical protein GLAREA_07332 [Glarea lozoyensis ATCC 20868]